jgi:hypothetical protein
MKDTLVGRNWVRRILCRRSRNESRMSSPIHCLQSSARPMSRPALACAPRALVGIGTVLFMLWTQASAYAGKLSWLDDVVHEVIVEAKAGGKGIVRDGDVARAELRRAGRLFPTRNANETLEQLVRRSEELAPAGRRAGRPAEAVLQARFSRLLRRDPQALRTFQALEPSEKWLVVELGETAEHLARRYPREAETMVRQLGPEGLSAVRVFGDDVAEVLAKEGSDGLGVLRKGGRGGWAFFTREVLPHKKKLAAAGVLALFLTNPEKFTDYAGQATEFAVREFAKAGIQLASAVSGGAARGLESSIGQTLAAYGLDHPLFRYIGIGLSGLVVLVSLLVILGMPLRWITWPVRSVLPRLVVRRPIVKKG